MLSLILAFGLATFPAAGPRGIAVAPVDLAIGVQELQLRQPLVARASGARLILFVRRTGDLKGAGASARDTFIDALPAGTLTGTLRGAGDRAVELEQGRYLFRRGYAGVELTVTAPVPRPVLFNRLEIASSRPLDDVRLVWIDRGGLQFEDLNVNL